MSLRHVHNGDAVYAAVQIVNDGSVPHADENEIFAEVGTMGMLINIGHFEENPDKEIFLVSFQLPNGELGPPVSCLEHELSAEPIVPYTSNA